MITETIKPNEISSSGLFSTVRSTSDSRATNGSDPSPLLQYDVTRGGREVYESGAQEKKVEQMAGCER